MARMPFGPVLQTLAHDGCDEDCRYLCFERIDPQGRVVRLTHGTWLQILAKDSRAMLANYIASLATAIEVPQVVLADPLDSRCLLYYTEPSDAGGKLLTVAVKCLPRRFQDGASQRRYDAQGRLARQPWGEAWVSSSYFVSNTKRRATRVWPS